MSYIGRQKPRVVNDGKDRQAFIYLMREYPQIRDAFTKELTSRFLKYWDVQEFCESVDAKFQVYLQYYLDSEEREYVNFTVEFAFSYWGGDDPHDRDFVFKFIDMYQSSCGLHLIFPDMYFGMYYNKKRDAWALTQRTEF